MIKSLLADLAEIQFIQLKYIRCGVMKGKFSHFFLHQWRHRSQIQPTSTEVASSNIQSQLLYERYVVLTQRIIQKEWKNGRKTGLHTFSTVDVTAGSLRKRAIPNINLNVRHTLKFL